MTITNTKILNVSCVLSHLPHEFYLGCLVCEASQGPMMIQQIKESHYPVQIMKFKHFFLRRARLSAYLIIMAFIIFVTVLYEQDLDCIFIKKKSQGQGTKSGKVDSRAMCLLGGGCRTRSHGRYTKSGNVHTYSRNLPAWSMADQRGGTRNGDGNLRCNLPRFNSTFMWEMLRGKRMMYIGDSLNRGQFFSMVCLLHSVIPENEKSMKTSYESLTVFRAEPFNASIEFYWAPFLVESNSDNAVIHRVSDRMVRAGSIKKHAKHWEEVDILVFNTYLWWMTGKKMKILRGSFEDEKKNIVEMETEDAYRMALESMSKWVDKHIDPLKTRVLFTTMSPLHEKSVEWGDKPGGNCYNQTTPIDDPNFWGRASSKGMMEVISNVFSKMKVPITVINITQLSEYRKDAHTSIYKKQWRPLTPEQLANPVSYADCVHWCLPGLQDTWNEVLYAKLFYPICL